MKTARLLLATFALVLTACAGGGFSGSGLMGQGTEKSRRAAELQVQLAQEYLKRGQLDVARDKLKRALEIDPYSAQAHTVSGFLHESIGDQLQAELHYRRAVELKPKDGGISNNFASFLCRLGRFDESDVLFQTAVADPYYKTPEVALTNAGVCARDGGRLEQAEGYLRDALARKPGYPDALLPMASVLFAREDYLRARAFLQRAEASAITGPEVLHLGMQIELALGDQRSAKEYRRRLFDSYPRSREALSLRAGE